MIETKPNLHRSWYDYNWDWALISLLALVLLAGIVVLWTMPIIRKPLYPTTLRRDRAPDQACRLSPTDLLFKFRRCNMSVRGQREVRVRTQSERCGWARQRHRHRHKTKFDED